MNAANCSWLRKGNMEKFEAKALELIGDWDRRIEEIREEEAAKAMFREAISRELAKRKLAVITAERLVLQSVRSEIKRLLS
jgi:hypothetical protein